MIKIVIVHFQPLEDYPPIMNFLDFFKTTGQKNMVRVYSMEYEGSKPEYKNTDVDIVRTRAANGNNRLKRLMAYLNFNTTVFWGLLKIIPDRVLYYESYSAWPVYWFYKISKSKASLFIHYHEYHPPEWYKKGMRSVAKYHNYEKGYLYHRAVWISQTNVDRSNLFIKDNPHVKSGKVHELPNYPSKAWIKTVGHMNNSKSSIKVVYVGSLSTTSSYIKEFCDWTNAMGGKITLHVFCHRPGGDIIDYLSSVESSFISYKANGIPYHELPEILQNYDIGLILYTGENINYKYNAPNKLFEYLACGLDVWFSKEMLGSYPYITDGCYPKVVKVDFNRLAELDLDAVTSRERLAHKPSSYFCEPVYESFYHTLINE